MSIDPGVLLQRLIGKMEDGKGQSVWSENGQFRTFRFKDETVSGRELREKGRERKKSKKENEEKEVVERERKRERCNW